MIDRVRRLLDSVRETFLPGFRGGSLVLGGGVLLILVVGYLLYGEVQRTRSVHDRAVRFRKLAGQYMGLSQREGTKRRFRAPENPLAYIEKILKKNNVYRRRLRELTPAGKTSEGDQIYRLRLEAVTMGKGLRVLRTVETEKRLLVRQFSVERTSLDSKRFDVRFQLQNPVIVAGTRAEN